MMGEPKDWEEATDTAVADRVELVAKVGVYGRDDIAALTEAAHRVRRAASPLPSSDKPSDAELVRELTRYANASEHRKGEGNFANTMRLAASRLSVPAHEVDPDGDHPLGNVDMLCARFKGSCDCEGETECARWSRPSPATVDVGEARTPTLPPMPANVLRREADAIEQLAALGPVRMSWSRMIHDAADQIDAATIRDAWNQNRVHQGFLATNEWREKFEAADDKRRSLASALEASEKKVDDFEGKKLALFYAIAHGSTRHRDWLQKAIDDHFKGNPVAAPVGASGDDALAAAQSALETEQAKVKGLEERRQADQRVADSFETALNEQRVKTMGAEALAREAAQLVAIAAGGGNWLHTAEYGMHTVEVRPKFAAQARTILAKLAEKGLA